MSMPSSFCASIMSCPRVQSEVADPCQVSPPSSSRLAPRSSRTFFTSVARCAKPPEDRPPPRRRAPAGIRDATASLVDWGVGVEQQRHQVRDLLFGQHAVVPEARHVGAGRERLGIVDLAVGVLLDRLARAAQLAELVEARADGAERQLLLRDLMAVVAAAAGRTGRVVGELLAGSALRDALALAPIAHELSGARVTDGRLLRLFDPVAHAFWQLTGMLAAERLRVILPQASDRRLAASPERGLYHLGRGALSL